MPPEADWVELGVEPGAGAMAEREMKAGTKTTDEFGLVGSLQSHPP